MFVYFLVQVLLNTLFQQDGRNQGEVGDRHVGRLELVHLEIPHETPADGQGSVGIR